MKTFRWMLPLLCGTFALSVNAPLHAQPDMGQSVPGFSSQQAQQIVGEKSRAVVRALQQNDTQTLARYVHPTRGVRFSPYINIENDHKFFRRSQVPFLAHHPRQWYWGVGDGTGDPIRRTWNSFRQRHLVPRPFLPLPSNGQENFNRVFQNGNTLNNFDDFYPQAIVTRYYLPGTEANGELNWRALYLAWRPVGQTWYLVGVAGDQWTI